MALPDAALVACSVLLLLASAVDGGYQELCCHNGQYTPNGRSACEPSLSGSFDTDLVPFDDGSGNIYYGPSAYEQAAENCRWLIDSPLGGGTFGVCVACTPGACGDPHVTGFDGSSYLLWGKPNATYDLISERSHHINVRLYHPPGRAARHALYMDAVGILINDARLSIHLQQPAAGSTAASMILVVHGAGSARNVLTWSGQPVEGAVDARTSYNFRTQAHILVTSRDITLSVVLQENDHLDVAVEEVATYWDDVHGIMGQTYGAAFQLNYNFAKASAVGHLPTGAELAKASKKRLSLKGSEDDYITSGLLKADDKFSRFVGAHVVVATRKLMSAADDRAGGHKVQSGAGTSATVAAGMPVGRRRSLLDTTFYCT